VSWEQLVADARRGKGPLRHARSILRAMRSARLPVLKPVGTLLSAERDIRHRLWPMFLQFIYREPMLRHRAARVGPRLLLEGALPLMYGDGRIEIGADVTIGGNNTWIIGSKLSTDAEFVIGDHVHIGYANGFNIAKSVRIGDHSILASWVEMFDNPTHPLDPGTRRRNEPVPLDEAAPIVIGADVWIGTKAMILRGVTIGDGSVVGAGSVVTRDVPPATLVAGNPARVIRELKPAD